MSDRRCAILKDTFFNEEHHQAVAGWQGTRQYPCTQETTTGHRMKVANATIQTARLQNTDCTGSKTGMVTVTGHRAHTLPHLLSTALNSR